MVRFALKTDPLGSVALAPVGYNLLARGRLPLGGTRVRAIEGLRKIVAKAQELGGD